MRSAEKGNKILASFEEKVGVVRNAEINLSNLTKLQVTGSSPAVGATQSLLAKAARLSMEIAVKMPNPGSNPLSSSSLRSHIPSPSESSGILLASVEIVKHCCSA